MVVSRDYRIRAAYDQPYVWRDRVADEPIGRAQAFRHRRSGMDGDAGPAAEPIPAVPSPRTPDRRGAVGVPVGGGGGEAFAESGSAAAG